MQAANLYHVCVGGGAWEEASAMLVLSVLITSTWRASSVDWSSWGEVGNPHWVVGSDYTRNYKRCAG